MSDPAMAVRGATLHCRSMQTEWFTFFRAGSRYAGASGTERRLIELRTSAALAVRRLRRKRGLTQKQLADRMGMGQGRVSNLEQIRASVSLDVYARALIELEASDDEIASAFNAGQCFPVKQLRKREQLLYYRNARDSSTRCRMAARHPSSGR